MSTVPAPPRTGIAARLRLVAELGKLRITLLSTLSALMGYVLAAGGVDAGLLVTLAGTWVLAVGSSTLNQIQERTLDARMARTRNRPLPSGRLSASAARAIAFVEILGGSMLLLATGSLWPWLLGLTAVLWYNGVYTPLKRRTAFAVVPGALIGAIPPVMGWTAAGGSPADPRILVVALFFFIWQVPHFWLLLFRYGPEYREAGFPSLTDVFDNRQLSRLTFSWTVATAAGCLLLPLFGAVRSDLSGLILLIGAALLVIQSARLLIGSAGPTRFFGAFRVINAFALLAIVAGFLDPWLA